MYTTLATVLALAASVNAKAASNQRSFAVNYFYGNGPLAEGRIDPIVSPGKLSGHVHTFMGGDALSMTMNERTALGAGCTNSKPKADKSNYWWPKMYFHDPNNGSFIDVELYYAKVYYFSEPTDDETKAFPTGFKMVAGNANKRSAPANGDLVIDSANGDAQAVQFMCGMTDKGKKPFGKGGALTDSGDNARGAGFPDAECDGYTTPLRYDIHFPSCYNPNDDNVKTRLAYPSSKGAKQGQNCPEGWIHTPHVFYEVYWNTPAFKDLWTPGQGKQPFVLSQGDPTGYGLHGDFISGWEEQTLQNLIDGCDAGTEGFDKCPTIDANGGVNPSEGQCDIPNLTSEKIHGVLDQLPGCNPLQYGPADATPQTSNCAADGGVEGPSQSAPASKPISTPVAGASSASKPAGSVNTPAPGYPTTLSKQTKPAASIASSFPMAQPPVATQAPKPSSSKAAPAPSKYPTKAKHHGHPHAHKTKKVKYVTATTVVKSYVTVNARAPGQEIGTA